MKKILLSLCFAAFLSAGLVSCTDEAAEVTPSFNEQSINSQMYLTDDKPGTGDTGGRP